MALHRKTSFAVKKFKICVQFLLTSAEEEAKKILDSTEKKEKEALECTSDGYIENYLVADMTLGISLTAQIYHYLKRVSNKQLEQCKSIIFSLAGLKCYFMRNQIAECVFSYIMSNNFSKDAIENVISDIEDIVGAVNSAYADILCIKWHFGQLINEEVGEKQAWKEIVKENGYGILGNPFESYEKEVSRDIENERGCIPPLSDLKPEDFADSMNVHEALIWKFRGLTEDDIRKHNEEKMREKQEIRRNNISGKKSVIYAKIHEIVVMRGVMDRNQKIK